MPRIHLCFLWHMHQPFYKDLVTGEYALPWTRMHALKDYYGMVKILDEFPTIRQTFNLVPCMVAQIEEYASGLASDPFLRRALAPAESLSTADREFILRYFFQANIDRLVRRYPRYGQLYDLFASADRDPRRGLRAFRNDDFRDLQVLSQLAWFDEEFLTKDAAIAALVRKGSNYSLEDQELLGRKQIEVTGKVMPVYREFAERGQIEVSTTPFYHPILPLVCDSAIASVSHPGVPLPSRFRYPGDARHQLSTAREYMTPRIGAAPNGLWPSEGSVSDEALSLAADCGFRWAATDNGVLARTLNTAPTPEVVYRPYVWRYSADHGQQQMHLLFRDHELSDLIGFTYQRVPAIDAANHFLAKIRSNCAPLLAAGRDALVPIILDGENCWEYYEASGREFLRRLYSAIAADPEMEAVTVSEALTRVEPQVTSHIFPASWISANFDVWIGAEEDNRAWEYLLRARQAYDVAQREATLDPQKLALAYEEILIAEGSDWCWWYGPEHSSDNREEFDQLFRDHLKNVYLALSLTPPEELSRSLLLKTAVAAHRPPFARIQPKIDGRVTSYFEWLGAGLYEVDSCQGAMHGSQRLIDRFAYGVSDSSLYLRLDCKAAAVPTLAQCQLQLTSSNHQIRIALSPGVIPLPDGEACLERVLELKLPRHDFDTIRMVVYKDGAPIQLLPESGSIQIQDMD